ncbi:MAG: PIN domain protein [Candidatus Bathyarchaeota archaeon BA1]|nr:MAG: PIN domain protein [Candidatus Bathyarchaeota archaeon BA1]
MKIHVSDAVAFLYFLLNKLPRRADEVFRQAENGEANIYLPTIVAAELYYLFERKGWSKYWTKLKNAMSSVATFRCYPFNEQVLDLFRHTKAREIHDKIIVSTTKVVKANALITKDEALKKLEEVNTIWL